ADGSAAQASETEPAVGVEAAFHQDEGRVDFETPAGRLARAERKETVRAVAAAHLERDDPRGVGAQEDLHRGAEPDIAEDHRPRKQPRTPRQTHARRFPARMSRETPLRLLQ